MALVSIAGDHYIPFILLSLVSERHWSAIVIPFCTIPFSTVAYLNVLFLLSIKLISDDDLPVFFYMVSFLTFCGPGFLNSS